MTKLRRTQREWFDAFKKVHNLKLDTDVIQKLIEQFNGELRQ